MEGRAGGTAGRQKGGERGRCTLETISSSGRSSVRSRRPPPPSYIACRGACIIWSNGEVTFALVVYGCGEGTMRRRGKRGRRCRQGQLGQRAVRTGQPCCGEGWTPTLLVESLGSRFCGAWGGEGLRGFVTGG